MKNYIAVSVFAAALFSGANSIAGDPAAPYDNSRIDARLNVTVKENTDVVHFVRDNADPNVITKAYVVKNIDPYELRSYLRAIVQTRKVTDNNTNIEAVKYTDGTSIVLISAEDYRFEDSDVAQGFDSIVKELDKPKLVSNSGRMTYLYSPKYRSAEELKEMVGQIGTYSIDPQMNNVGGGDVVVSDPGLNLLFFKTSPFSYNTIADVLAKYDQPYPAVRAKITVYELYAENDTKLGLDFQAWKNNDGIDLFSAGGRFSRNYDNIAIELANGAKWNDATYFQFNPKWNTKYIDFLTSKGKAKILHSSEITLRNGEPGIVSKTTQVFVAKSTPIPDQTIDAGNTTAGEDIITNKRGNKITTEPASVDFGFAIHMLPYINTKATKLNVIIDNSSLIGYTSDGSPRIQQSARINSDFMISNEGSKLVIGGIEKRSVMRVSGGVPFLKDLPVIGWIFSTETEATKRSQLLVVAEVMPLNKAADYQETIDQIKGSLTKAGESNSYGYRQYGLDPERTK